MGGRNDEVGGRRSWEAGLASDALEALPHSPPPLWIPAFAGMTKWGAGMTKWGGAGMTMVGGRPAVRGWWLDGVLPRSLAAPLDSGLRRNDEVGGRNDDDGGGPE